MLALRAVGRAPPLKRLSPSDLVPIFETLSMSLLFVASALCVLAAILAPAVLKLIPVRKS